MITARLVRTFAFRIAHAAAATALAMVLALPSQDSPGHGRPGAA